MQSIDELVAQRARYEIRPLRKKHHVIVVRANDAAGPFTPDSCRRPEECTLARPIAAADHKPQTRADLQREIANEQLSVKRCLQRHALIRNPRLVFDDLELSPSQSRLADRLVHCTQSNDDRGEFRDRLVLSDHE